MTMRTTDIQITDALTLWSPKGNLKPTDAGEIVCSFLDTATTSMGRATHYNTREEQQAAELASHDLLMEMSRDLYAVLLSLPGVTDRSMQVGMKKLLSTPRNGAVQEFLDPTMERAVLYHLIQSLPVPRMLRLIEAFRVGNEEAGIKKANNARTRKLILRTLLDSPRLSLWAVKYRTKMAAALTHAWGQRTASIVRDILKKDGRSRTAKERGILSTQIDKFVEATKQRSVAYECVRFIFGDRDKLTLPILKAFVAAKTDLKAGSKLPLEVLEGIRATYHKDVPKEEALKLTAKGGKMSAGTRMAVQKRAKAADVEITMDPTKYDAVRLYLYAFEMGLTEEISAALKTKAARAAAGFPSRYESVGIIVDCSASMAGSKEQPLRPLAATLALRDMLECVGEGKVVHYVGGQMGKDRDTRLDLIKPQGDTALADALVDVLHYEPDVVFVLSDGYENTPAGRFAEVLEQVRDIGIKTPVYHLNPVFAAESKGVRELAPSLAPTLPVKGPEALGSTILRGLIENEPLKGINALVRMALTSGPVEMRTLADR